MEEKNDDLLDSDAEILEEPSDVQSTGNDSDDITQSESNNSSENNDDKPVRSVRRIISELIIYVAIILICIFVVPRYIVQRTVVKGTSMTNTLHNGESLIVEKVSYHFSNPNRFDIIVFYPFGRDDPDDYYVKRVIGLPGETIQIKGADIYINDKKLDESYGKDPIIYSGIANEPLKLADDEYFVMGDNRTDSYDSRYAEIGPVTKDKIAGQVVLRIYPFDKFGIMTNK